MSVTIPRDQRSEALSKANQARRARQSLQDDLAPLNFSAATEELARILREEPERLGPVQVYRVLEAVPRLGSATVRRLLTRPEFPIWPLRRCRELTERQRLWLAGQLERMAASGRRRVR